MEVGAYGQTDRQTDDGHVAIGHICAMQAIRPEFGSQIANVSSICITANSGKIFILFSIKSSILYLNSAKTLNNFVKNSNF